MQTRPRFYACPRYLRLMKTGSKLKELAWRYRFSPLLVNGSFLLPWQTQFWWNLLQTFPNLTDDTYKIWSILANWSWRFHKSIENLIRPQGHVTSKWLNRSGLNSILCLSCLPASSTKVLKKMNELASRHHFPIISIIFRRSRAP